MMNTIRWGILGVGDVTEVKSGPGFQRADHSELVAVMRRTGHLAQDYAARHNVPRWYDDAAALINDPEVDAVYIATPPHVHYQYTLLAAQAGKPVYVEKPMALTYADCTDMIATCEAAGVPLYVAYYRRALPRFLKVKTLLDSGAIGEPRYVTVTLSHPAPPELKNPQPLPWRVQPAIAGGGLFVDVGSHMLDLLDYLLGPIHAVKGQAANQGGYYPAEDLVTGSFEFESGVQGVGVWSFAAYAHADRIEIMGSRGTVTFACFAEAPVTLVSESGNEQFEIVHPPHIQQPLIQTVVNALRGVGECSSTGVSGARTTWVMEQLLTDYYAAQS